MVNRWVSRVDRVAASGGTRVRSRFGAVILAGALTVALAGCASSTSSDEAQPSTTPGTATSPQERKPAADASPEPEPEPAARVQDETCDWDSPALSGGADAPAAQDGALTEVLVGAWQHTHYDTGAGFEAVENDIRYVFPSTARILYCQHVPGVTDHAENAADFTLNDTAIDLPGGAPGFVVTEWDDDAMVWLNRADDSRYLLQRR